MDHITCPVKLLHPAAKPPTAGNAFAMGYDLTCVAGVEGLDMSVDWNTAQLRAWSKMTEDGGVDLLPGQSFLFRTGFAQAIDTGFGCLLWDRSGMGGKKRIHRLAGVIDEDYRGEWFVCLVNHSDKSQRINVGDKIVQAVYQRRVVAQCPIVDDLPHTFRGASAFGSTGD